jgi:hypothetical protein
MPDRFVVVVNVGLTAQPARCGRKIFQKGVLRRAEAAYFH